MRFKIWIFIIGITGLIFFLIMVNLWFGDIDENLVKEAIVIISSGQSNEDSKAEIDGLQSYHTFNGNIKLWVKPDLTSNNNGAWRSYDAISGNNINVQNKELNERWYCHVAGLGQMLYEKYNKPIYVIKIAKGATYLESLVGNYDSVNRDFNPASTDDYFEILTDRWITPALDNLIQSGLTPNVKFISWYQGESDGGNATYASNYLDNLTGFVSNLRNYRTELNNLKLIISRVQNISGLFPYIGDVRTAQDSFCRYTVSQAGLITDNVTGDENSYSLDIDDLPTKDGVHLTSIGHDTRAERIYNYLNLIFE